MNGRRVFDGLMGLASLVLVACHAYDEGALNRGRNDPRSDAGRMDGGLKQDGGMGDASLPTDGGSDACVTAADSALEDCNRQDDDCDGKIDEDTLAVCETRVVNAETECVPFAMTARCVLVECLGGFANCDGNPANGCESYCDCNECPDAGTEDAGS